jgi:4-hydroxy-L-threonine phosphate dehydrogenase PdxA
MARSLPRILISTGDPNGIGPEIAVKALLSHGLHGRCRPLLVGSPPIIRKAARTLQVKIPVREFKIEKAGALPSPFSRASGKPSFLPVIPVDMPLPAGLEPGKIQRQAGRMAYRILVKAHHLIQAGHGDGLATCPIHKEAIHKAGYARVAHTEILSLLTGCADPLTLFVTGRLWIAFFTRHLPLSQAIKAIKAPALVIFVKRLVKELQTESSYVVLKRTFAPEFLPQVQEDLKRYLEKLGKS